MLRRTFFSSLIITLIYETHLGFINSPCCVRNTALLNPLGHWTFPKDPIQCVDVTSMGKRTSIPHSHAITHATTLYADHMNLKSIPEFALTVMPHLELIDLTGNRLRRLSKDAFLPLVNLQILLVGDNSVVVPKKTPLLNSPSLTTLSLSNNKIRRLKPSTFKELPALKVLYLDRNFLVRVHPKVFKSLKYLKYLHLGNNRLKVMPGIVLRVSRAVVIVKGNPLGGSGSEVIKR